MDLFPVVFFLQLLNIQESFSAILVKRILWHIHKFSIKIIIFQTPFVTTLERSSTTCDGDTIAYCNATVKRFNRTSPYMLYVYSLIEKPLNHNFTMIMKSYEWKDNQYKESFISFKKNLCDFLEKDQLMSMVVKNFAALPKKCPFKVGTIQCFLNVEKE